MLSLDRIPRGFRILSETPILRMQFRSQANGCLIVFLLPFVALFLVYSYVLMGILSEILSFGPWHVWQKLPSMVANYWWFPFCFLGFSVPTWFVLWHTVGITHFQVSQDSLIVIKQLFVIQLKKSILNNEM